MKKFYFMFAILGLLMFMVQTVFVNSNNLSAKEIDFHKFPTTQDSYLNSQVQSKNINTKTNSYTRTSGSGSSTADISKKSRLDSLAMKALRAAENHDNDAMNQYAQDMVKMGIDSIYPPHITAKQTPTCPPIEMQLNGKTLKGSLCGKMGYTYKGKTYWVGYCNP